jgi:hypothetical protein
VNPALLALGAAVVLSAVVAGSSRDARVAIVGLVAALAGGALVVDPLPDPLAVAARIVAAALAGYLLRIAVRRAPTTRGTWLGWPAEIAIAGAAFAAGVAAVVGPIGETIGPLGGSPAGTPALATGFALVAVSATGLLDVRDGFRLAIGLLLLTAGVDLIRTGLAGPPSALEDLAVGGLMVGLGAAGAIVVLRGSEPPEGIEPAPHLRPGRRSAGRDVGRDVSRDVLA